MTESFENIDKTKLPQHIAAIMDGNGRWAKSQGKDRLYGHQYGVRSVRNMVESCAELGIPYLTLYAFSTENWNRPAAEVEGLMTLLISTLSSEIEKLNENNTQLRVIGDIESLPEECNRELAEAIEYTAHNDGLILTLALSYSSRWEITRAAKLMAQDVLQGKINIDDIQESNFESYLMTHGSPDPDLLIRSSGEHRISNYLLYQIAYTELYFTDTLWPDFDKEEFAKAILDYQNRERRYGKISEQLNS